MSQAPPHPGQQSSQIPPPPWYAGQGPPLPQGPPHGPGQYMNPPPPIQQMNNIDLNGLPSGPLSHQSIPRSVCSYAPQSVFIGSRSSVSGVSTTYEGWKLIKNPNPADGGSPEWGNIVKTPLQYSHSKLAEIVKRRQNTPVEKQLQALNSDRQREQVKQILEDTRYFERDPSFEWNLASIEPKIVSSVDPKKRQYRRETEKIIVILKRKDRFINENRRTSRGPQSVSSGRLSQVSNSSVNGEIVDLGYRRPNAGFQQKFPPFQNQGGNFMNSPPSSYTGPPAGSLPPPPQFRPDIFPPGPPPQGNNFNHGGPPPMQPPQFKPPPPPQFGNQQGPPKPNGPPKGPSNFPPPPVPQGNSGNGGGKGGQNMGSHQGPPHSKTNNQSTNKGPPKPLKPSPVIVNDHSDLSDSSYSEISDHAWTSPSSSPSDGSIRGAKGGKSFGGSHRSRGQRSFDKYEGAREIHPNHNSKSGRGSKYPFEVKPSYKKQSKSLVKVHRPERRYKDSNLDDYADMKRGAKLANRRYDRVRELESDSESASEDDARYEGRHNGRRHL